MKYTTGLLLLIVTVLTACDSSNNGRVAIVDLDEIASAIGRDTMITERVQQFTREQEVSLIKLRDEMLADMKQHKEKLGKKPGQQKQDEFNKLAQSTSFRLQQEIARVEEVAAQMRVNLVMEFKKDIEPVARKVAAQRGMGVVMIKQNAMLSVSEESDITGDVIDQFKRLSVAADTPERQSVQTLAELAEK